MLNKKPIILIADDEPNICRIAKLVIDPDKYDILTAENGHDAFEKTLKHHPALIFSDILMPKCNGFELCEKVKQHNTTQHIPFIFLSAIEEEKFKEKYITTQGDDYIIKPFTADNITEKLEKWIKKPIINSEEASIKISPAQASIELGLADIDIQLKNDIPKKTFLFAYGPQNCNTQHIITPFIEDGLNKKQNTLLLSFNEQSPFINTEEHAEGSEKLLFYCNASQWTNIQSKPWRNLDYIYDFLHEQCQQRPIHRIVIDGLHHGYPFWSIKDILKFINLCRDLPNHKEQVMLWTSYTHPKLTLHEFYIQNVMDIGIQLTNEASPDNAMLDFNKLSLKETAHTPA
jgi:CheY-like chemotaxis protein